MQAEEYLGSILLLKELSTNALPFGNHQMTFLVFFHFIFLYLSKGFYFSFFMATPLPPERVLKITFHFLHILLNPGRINRTRKLCRKNFCYFGFYEIGCGKSRWLLNNHLFRLLPNPLSNILPLSSFKFHPPGGKNGEKTHDQIPNRVPFCRKI